MSTITDTVILYNEQGKIITNGTAPTKAQIYLTAAELVDVDEGKNLILFKDAIIAAMKLYDYYYDFDYYDFDYEYSYNFYYEYSYVYSYKEKVIALLFLAEIYS